MVRTAIIGAGKMGISHLSILGANPKVNLVGVCDTSKIVTEMLTKYSSMPCFDDYKVMVETAKPEAVVVSVPTKYHYEVSKYLLERGIHVFVEKPFCLSLEQGKELMDLAAKKNLVNQVGYHNKFVGTFQEVKRILDGGFIGNIYHFEGEAYGPVVTKKKADTWRSDPAEGGGCLMDYASHVIDLINYLLAPITECYGSIVKPVFSSKVDDVVFSLLKLSNDITGLLSVNWSDDTYRKMSTSITVIGDKGKIISDANELKIYFKDKTPEGYSKGWNVKYITDLTTEVDFYLRGEEYSLQMDHFINTVDTKATNSINTFESAYYTDRAINLIKTNAR